MCGTLSFYRETISSPDGASGRRVVEDGPEVKILLVIFRLKQWEDLKVGVILIPTLTFVSSTGVVVAL